LVWLCARVLTAGDARSEIWAAAGEIQADATASELAHALPQDATVTVLGWPDEAGEALPRRGDVKVLAVDTGGEAAGFVSRLWRGDVDASDVPQSGLGAAVAASTLVLLETPAMGPDEFLAPSGSRAAAATARHAGIPVWLVAGVGRRLPARMWEGLRRRVEPEEEWDADDEFVPLGLVDVVVGASGPESVEESRLRTDCPVAPELFKGDVF
jgi:hypothetical protein